MFNKNNLIRTYVYASDTLLTHFRPDLRICITGIKQRKCNYRQISEINGIYLVLELETCSATGIRVVFKLY